MIETFTKNSLFIKEDSRTQRWSIPYHYEALNSRVENLIIKNISAIKNKKILDLGCHFGTFSYACLEHGAQFVKGIDSEKKLIDQGKKLFKEHNVPKDKYNFQEEEIISYLEKTPKNSFDTILCLGIFYYLNDPVHVLTLMKKVAKKYIILDTFTAYYVTSVTRDREQYYKNTTDETFNLPLVFYPLTQAKKKDYTLNNLYLRPKRIPLSMLSLPTIPALENFFNIIGLEYKELNWKNYIQNPNITWKDFRSQEAKQASHWADVYHTKLRISYLLEVLK